MYQPTKEPIYLSINLPIYHSINLSVYRYTHLSIYQSIRIRSNLLMYQFTRLSSYRDNNPPIYKLPMNIELSIYLCVSIVEYQSIDLRISIYNQSIYPPMRHSTSVQFALSNYQSIDVSMYQPSQWRRKDTHLSCRNEEIAGEML